MLVCKWIPLTTATFVAVGVVGVVGVAAGQTLLKVSNTWMGAVDDEKLAKEMPANGVITNAKDFEALVKAWKVADKVPDVDFDREIVLVAKTEGSKLRLNASLDEKGDLRALGLATRDLRPGLRYVIISVPREGVKTVNGKTLPK